VIESQGLRKQKASAVSYLKLKPLPSGNEQRSLNDTSSRKTPPNGGEERTAGGFCCNRLNPKARGCNADLVSAGSRPE